MLVNDNSSPSPWLLVLVPIPKIANTWFLSSMWPFGIPSCPYFGILEQSVLSEKNALSLEFSTSYQYVCPCLVNSALNVRPLMRSFDVKYFICAFERLFCDLVSLLLSFLSVLRLGVLCEFKMDLIVVILNSVPKWFYTFCELLYTCIVLTRISICLSRLLTLVY